MKDNDQSSKVPLSHARQAWLMLLVIAPMAACYPAIKVGLGLAGVTLMALPPLREQPGHPILGAMLALGSSASAAVASVTVKRLRPGNDLMSLTAWQLVAGSVVLLGLSAVFEPNGTITWTGGFVGLLLFLALAGTALSTWLWFWLLQRAEAGRLSLYLFLVPVSGLLIAMNYELNLITLDEQLCRQLQVQFEQDLTESAEIGIQVWEQRKWKEYSFETIGWLSRKWL